MFKKYNLDFNLVFISSSGIVTAALLGGDAEMTVTGGVGNVAAYVQGSTDVVFIGGVKNTMTQTLVAGGNIKKPEDLKGKKIGVSRIGGNSHYFTIQALRRARHGRQSGCSIHSNRRRSRDLCGASSAAAIDVANSHAADGCASDSARGIIMWFTARI